MNPRDYFAYYKQCASCYYCVDLAEEGYRKCKSPFTENIARIPDNCIYYAHDPSYTETDSRGNYIGDRSYSSSYSTSTTSTPIKKVASPTRPQIVRADNTREQNLNTGAFGKNLTWGFDTYTGVLKISGRGYMDNYSEDFPSPWYTFKELIRSIIIDEGVMNIGANAFFECEELINITVPDSVTAIEECAFGNCKKLRGFKISKNLTKISKDVFFNCSSLSTIVVDEQNQFYSSMDNCLFNKDKTRLIRCSANISHYIIPYGVKHICSCSFRGCDKLNSVTFPASVVSIGRLAFGNCKNLKQVKLNNGLNSIDKFAFMECTNMKEIEIPDSVTSISDNVFWYINAPTCFIHCTSQSYAYKYAHENKLENTIDRRKSLQRCQHCDGDFKPRIFKNPICRNCGIEKDY